MVRRWAFIVTALTLAACDSGRLGAPRGATLGGVGGTSNAGAARIVGTWRRILYFLADDGSASASETTWRFNADGSASPRSRKPR